MLAPAPSRTLLTLDLCSSVQNRPEAQHHHRVGPAAPSQVHRTGESLRDTAGVPRLLGKECNADTCALHLPHALQPQEQPQGICPYQHQEPTE